MVDERRNDRTSASKHVERAREQKRASETEMPTNASLDRDAPRIATERAGTQQRPRGGERADNGND